MGKCGARGRNTSATSTSSSSARTPKPTVTRIAGEMMRLASEAFFGWTPRAGGARPGPWSHAGVPIAYYQRWAKPGSSGAAEGARPAVGDAGWAGYVDALMPMVWTACERGSSPGPGHAPAGGVPGARRPAVPPNQAGHRRLRDVSSPCSCSNSCTAAPTIRCTSRPPSTLAALGAGGTSAATTHQPSPPPTVPPAARAPAAVTGGSSGLICCPPRRRRGAALAGARGTMRRTANDSLGGAARGTQATERRVSKLHNAKLFYQPLLESVGPSLELRGGPLPEAAGRQLAALGYEGPQSALTHLAALVNSSGRRGRSAGGAAAAAVGLAVGHARSGQRPAGLPPDQ